MNRNRYILCYAMVILFVIGLNDTPAQNIKVKQSTSPPRVNRHTIIISDLHAGPGKYNNNTSKWRNTEDFRWHKEFDQFLNEYVFNDGGNNTDLIILGDMLELWQSANMECRGEGLNLRCVVKDCEYTDKNLGCNEAEALARTQNILSQHGELIKTLKSFVSKGTNRIIIIPGNHDAALLYPQVARAVVSAIKGSTVDDAYCKKESRICVESKGYWISPDGLIYADHGHSFDKANRFDNWPKPFSKDGKHLQRPSGEQTVQKFYNTYEERYPILDNLDSELEGIRLGIHTEGIRIVNEIGEFARYLLLQTSWAQFRGFLGKEKEQPPDWDIEAIKTANSPEFLIGAIDFSDDPVYEVSMEALRQNKFALRPKDFTDEELKDMCDVKLLRKRAGDKKVVLCNDKRPPHLGERLDKILDREEENMKNHLVTVWSILRNTDKQTKPFKFYIYGHTHAAKENNLKISEPGESWDLKVLNTGAFQRVVSKNELEVIKKRWRDKNGKELEDRKVLTELQPEDLPARYTFVRIAPYTKTPSPELLYWAYKDGWRQLKRSDLQ